MTQSPRFSLATVVLDCPDAHALSDFYRRLLGWEVKWSEPDWVLLRGPEGGTSLSFQSEADYRPPVWPELPGEQQKMQHLDIEVDDLDEAGAHAVAEGATLADFNRRTMFASTSTLPGTPSACSSGEGAALFTTGDPLADAGQHIIDVVTGLQISDTWSRGCHAWASESWVARDSNPARRIKSPVLYQMS